MDNLPPAAPIEGDAGAIGSGVAASQ